jgi:Flp pilus assembly protein TadG
MRRGQAMIEMALVVTVLLFLTLGLIQYGILANARITQTNIAREGARYAAVHALDTSNKFPAGTCGLTNDRNFNDDPDGAIKFYMTNCVADSTPLRDLVDTNIVISPAKGGLNRNSGNPINITVNYNLRNKFILPVSFPGLNKFGTTTAATATMVIE